MVSIKIVLVLLGLCDIISAESYTNSSRNIRAGIESLGRQSRFISFQTLDDDLKVALEFIVPFISVPVKRTVDEASKGIANINIAALVLTGITVVAGVSTASALSHLARMASNRMKTQRSSDIFSDMGSFNFEYRRSNGDRGEAPVSEIFSNVEAIFREYDIDITSCVQKTLCLLVQESINNVSEGKGTSSNKIIDGLTSTNWLLNVISGTAVKEAIDIGRSNYKCSYKYSACKWSDHDLREFIETM